MFGLGEWIWESEFEIKMSGKFRCFEFKDRY